MKEILLTGVSGFIGRNLSTYLSSKFEILGLDRKMRDEIFSSLKLKRYIKKDLLKITPKDIIQNNVTMVVHLAAMKDVKESLDNPLTYIKNNVLGTAHLLELCRISDVKKFIYVSSSSVYGNTNSLPIYERQSVNPTSVYGYTKLWGEELIKMYSRFYGIKYVILRLFNVYGPGQSSEYAGVITKFIDRVSRGLPPIIYGDGLQTRDFVHVYDVCRAIELAIEKDVQGTFNIGSGRPTRIIDLAKMILRLMGREDLKPVFKPPREGDIRHSWADISKARKYLGFEPKISLEEGLRDLIENWDKYRNNT